MAPDVDTPHERARGFVGETPRPRMPLSSIVGVGYRSQQGPGNHLYGGDMKCVLSAPSSKRQMYTSVSGWPTSTEYPGPMTSTTRVASSTTPLHPIYTGDSHNVPPYSSTRRRIGTASVPKYTSTSGIHPTPKPSFTTASSSAYRESTAARLFGDDNINVTTSRLIKGVPQSQEVVLFALHPQTVITPLRKYVRQMFTGLLEWILDSLQRQGMPRNVALSRLNRTRWFQRLFDYVAIERTLNVFKLYINQSDALAVPRDFTDVYEAFSHEINRYCLSEATRSPPGDTRAGRAIVVGGIDFTEETLKSMTRPLEPCPHQSHAIYNHTPIGATPGINRIVAAVSVRAGINRRYIINHDNLSVLGSLVSKLEGVLRQRQGILDSLLQERFQLVSHLNERKVLLLKLCVSLTNQRIIADSLDFKRTLDDVKKQFDSSQTGNRTSRYLDDIEQHMRIIGRCARSISNM
eukprot:XP_001608920.1 hypothetical protein [Babesia bovis T2Bo]